jgi:hypothetical protein
MKQYDRNQKNESADEPDHDYAAPRDLQAARFSQEPVARHSAHSVADHPCYEHAARKQR